MSEGERHELGALIAAVSAAEAGAGVTYLGPELPVDEVVGASERTAATAVALSIVTLERDVARRYLSRLRKALPAQTAIWVGGAGSEALSDGEGITRLDLRELTQAIARHAGKAR